MSNEQIKLAFLEETRELLRREKLALELFDILDARMLWLIRFCRQNGIRIPNQDAIIREEARIKYLMGRLSGASPAVKRDFKSPDFEEGIPEPLPNS